MKRFQFSLQKLLELRSFYEKQAEMDLAQKAGACALLEAKLKQLALEAFQARAFLSDSSCTLDERRSVEFFLLRLERDRKKTEKDLAMAELEREKSRLAYIEARKQKTVIEKLKEKKETEYYALNLKVEQAMLDDMANARFGR